MINIQSERRLIFGHVPIVSGRRRWILHGSVTSMPCPGAFAVVSAAFALSRRLVARGRAEPHKVFSSLPPVFTQSRRRRPS